MAKSLGEINYEFLLAFFGGVKGHEDFFTSDDGDEVLVIPRDPQADASVENRAGVPKTAPSRTDSAEAEKRSRVRVSPPRGANVVALLISGIAAVGRTLGRLMRRRAA